MMFKTVNASVSTGACPFCSREAFRYKNQTITMFLCHNCQRHMPFSKLGIEEKEAVESIQINYTNVLDTYCVKVSTLPESHKARKYAAGRKIPLDLVYYTARFGDICKFGDQPNIINSERLILPFFTEDGKLFGVQGRSLDPNDKLRYITIMFDKKQDKVFGLERVDFSKRVYVLEGPIDSFFVENAIAMAGSDLTSNKYLTQNVVVCYDNEPRSSIIVNKIKKSIKAGVSVVIWPQSIKEKDCNDMVLSGHNVNEIVRNNTYSGLLAELKLNEWKKV